MNQPITPADLGQPALQLAGFQLWVHDRRYPDAMDWHDGNWLRITAHCAALGASVWAQGAILKITDIAEFGDGCRAMVEAHAKSTP